MPTYCNVHQSKLVCPQPSAGAILTRMQLTEPSIWNTHVFYHMSAALLMRNFSGATQILTEYKHNVMFTTYHKND